MLPRITKARQESAQRCRKPEKVLQRYSQGGNGREKKNESVRAVCVSCPNIVTFRFISGSWMKWKHLDS